MELIVDANIIFAALIKSNITSDLIVENGLNLYSCEFLFTEFEKYRELIKRKTKRTDEDFERFRGIIEKRIKLIPNEEIEEYIDEAEKNMSRPEGRRIFCTSLETKYSNMVE